MRTGGKRAGAAAFLGTMILTIAAGAAQAAAQQVPWRAGHGPQAPSAAPRGDDERPLRLWTGADYDPAIPALKDVVGHENGERITRPEDVVAYFRALEKAAPDRIRVWEYARSWENRPLIYAALGSPENIARLDALKEGMQALADPRRADEAEARRLIADLPGTVWLAYGVHGNEISSTDAAIMTAYHLIAARGDPTVEKILANTVVFLDPMQNPDGRARFVHNFESAEGLEPSGARIAAERNEPWPGGRTNHYLFDMNRDWFALTQPETQGRVKILREWLPLVFVDAHEMGTDSTYYFAPEAVPYNPHLAPAQRANLELFGRNNARWFDRNGFLYFTREIYDAFYPGYGASWPSYYGAVAMTYEQSSARGLKARRTDGSEYHFRDTVRRHFIASVATAETVADNRAKLLADFRFYRKSAIEEGRRGPARSYILPPSAAADRIAGLLVRQGAEVRTANAGFSACGRDYPAGTHVIPLAQPAKRLIRTLLDPETPLPEDFLAEQERRRDKDLPDQIYDVTAWSLPLMFNTRMDACDATLGVGALFRDHDGRLFEPGRLTGPEEAVAYLVDWGETPAARFLARLHRDGVPARSADLPFVIDGRRYRAGALIVLARDGGPDLRARLARYARETGADVQAVASSWASEGPNFGSRNVVAMPAPKIALAWDEPTSAYAAGATRFVIERRFDYPVVAARAADLADRTLDSFDVLILPGGEDYARVLGESGVARLKDWVEQGGVLIATGRAVRFLSDPDTDLLSIRRENAAREREETDPPMAEEDAATAPGTILETPEDARKAIAPVKEPPDPAAGALVRATADPDHWLAAGVAPVLHALVSGGDIYTPVRLDKGVNVARFEGPARLVAAGHLWAETAAQLAYKPFVVVEPRGDGYVIAFTQDPTVRGYLEGLDVIFANALFRAPAHAAPAR